MRKIMNRDEGFTGLEAAIVLIAFVVVAAVFSYVVLGAGFFTTQKSQEVVYTSVEMASSNMEVIGDVYGLAASTTTGVDTIRFTVGLSAGGSWTWVRTRGHARSVTPGTRFRPRTGPESRLILISGPNIAEPGFDSACVAARAFCPGVAR